MPIKELEAFRAKYPGYNDIDDATLASKLASKYPDAYGDLPDKVKSETTLEPMSAHAPKETIMDRVRREVIPTTTEPVSTTPVDPAWKMVAPAIGSGLGSAAGLLAGPGAPAVVPAFGALGYMAGEAFNRAVQNQPTTANDVISDASKGMGQEIAGGLLNKAVGYLGKGKTITPAMAEKQDLASELAQVNNGKNVMTPADITGSMKNAALETQLNKSIVTGNIAQKAHAEKVAALGKYAEKVQSEIGPSITRTMAGEEAQKSTKVNYKQFMDAAQKLYNEIPVDKEAIVPVASLSETAASMSDELGKIGNPTIKKILGVAETNVPYKWGELLQDKSAIQKVIARTSDANTKRMLYKINNAIMDDISAFSTTASPEIKPLLEKANKFYAYGNELYAGVKAFRDPEIKQLLKTTKPDEIVNMFFKPKKENIASIARLKRVAGAGYQDLKAAWTADVMSRGADGTFSPLQFSKTWKAYPEAVKKEMFTPTEYEGLNKLAKLSEMSLTSESLAGNPSGSGVFGGNFWTLIQMFRHPVLMSAGGLTANGFAKAYFTNPKFQKLLIEGMKFPPGSAKAAEIAGKIGTIAASQEYEKMGEEQ